MIDYGLSQSKLYRIPASAVSYTPGLAGARVWYAGKMRQAPAGGGTFALFTFADGPVDGWGESVWLRPFAVMEAS